jgi:hypothetical protein
MAADNSAGVSQAICGQTGQKLEIIVLGAHSSGWCSADEERLVLADPSFVRKSFVCHEQPTLKPGCGQVRIASTN